LIGRFEMKNTQLVMHAANQVTPEVLLTLCIGGIIFVIVFWAIFRKKKH